MVSQRLRDLRIRRGWSQQELAEKARVTKSAISMYENGQRDPNNDTLELFADIFNVTTDYLLGREEGSIYYLDPEAAEIAQELIDRPELKILFDASRKVSAEDLRFVQELVDRIVSREQGE